MSELDAGDRSRVGRAVRRGEATDARLGATVVHYGKRIEVLSGVVAIDCLVLAVLRMTSLCSDSGAGDRAFDVAGAALWIGIAMYTAFRFARARRAVTVAGASTVSPGPAP